MLSELRDEDGAEWFITHKAVLLRAATSSTNFSSLSILPLSDMCVYMTVN